MSVLASSFLGLAAYALMIAKWSERAAFGLPFPFWGRRGFST
jgi:hypothetical protein